MSLQGLHFLDIETVSGYRSINHMPKHLLDLYLKKFQKDEENGIGDEHYADHAGLMAEFGKIVRLSVGGMHTDGNFYIRSMGGRHEKPLLEAFKAKLIEAKVSKLVGHNLKEFDAPFIMRRMIANGIILPPILNTFHLKPWETPFIDTMDMWKGSSTRHMCGLELLCATLCIPSPKEDMSGADVNGLYWGMFDGLDGQELPFEKEESVLKQIGNYCGRDVLATAQVYSAMKGMPLIKEENVKYL